MLKNGGWGTVPGCRRVTADERDIIRALYPRFPISEIARKLGRSRNTVAKVVRGEGLDAPAPKPAHDLSGAAAEMDGSDLSRLRELRERLRVAMMDAPPAALAALAREYRATIEAIERMEGGDGDGSSAALDTIARAISSKMPAS